MELCEFIELTNFHRGHTKKGGRIALPSFLTTAAFLRGCSHKTTKQIELHQRSPKVEQGLLDLDLSAKVLQSFGGQNIVLPCKAQHDAGIGKHGAHGGKGFSHLARHIAFLSDEFAS